MISLVIGTDVPFVWHVKANGQPVQLENHTVTLYVENSRGSFRLSELVIEGDQVRATYPGAIQTRLGDHSLILRLNEGQKGMATVSVQNAFKLVAWGKDAGGENEGPVQVNALVFESELSFGNAEVDLSAYLTKEEAERTYWKKGEGGESYDDTEIRQELTELSAEVSGLSERVDELGKGGSEIFKAEYGVTTYEEVNEAYNQGKIIHCDYNGNCYVLSSFVGGQAWFVAIVTTTINMLFLGANGWNRATYYAQSTGNKVTTIDAASTDNVYPSAKAVYDFVNTTLGTLINGDY